VKLITHDPTWIERDVVLEEINRCAIAAGLSALAIVPMQHAAATTVFLLRDWLKFRRGTIWLRSLFSRAMATVNYDQRGIYCDKARERGKKLSRRATEFLGRGRTAHA
jgi:hypothetical protein